MSHIEKTDLRQQAAFKCLSGSKKGLPASKTWNPDNPYTGPYYHAAWRSVERDAHRRHKSYERRLNTFFDSSETRERYCPDKRSRGEDFNNDDPANQTVIREDLELLQAAIAVLEPKQRELVEACDLLGESFDAVAQKLGKTKSAIRNQHYRARVQLQELMRRSAFIIIDK